MRAAPTDRRRREPRIRRPNRADRRLQALRLRAVPRPLQPTRPRTGVEPMTATQRRRKQTKARTKTPRRPKAPNAAFWAERAAKIAAARARNERSGMTERERRAQRKAERAKLAAKGAKTTTRTTTKTTPAPTTTKTKTPRADVSSGAYIARVLKAIDKNTGKSQRAYVSRYLGADGGAGWVVLGTDGHRALLQVGTITNDAKIAQPLVTATGPAF